jgi:hypothetical protein
VDRNTFEMDNIFLEGPPRHLNGTEITDVLDKLVLGENGDEFVGYRKVHNWIHKCGLWELPNAKELILMHNIDIMHKECNIGESILSTCMSFTDKAKDNLKARSDLAQICNRPTLELIASGGKPCAILF